VLIDDHFLRIYISAALYYCWTKHNCRNFPPYNLDFVFVIETTYLNTLSVLLSYIVYALLHSFVHLILFNPSHCKNRKRQKFPDIPQGFVFFAVSHLSDMLSAKSNTYLKTNGLPAYFVELSVITSLWKTDFIHSASFTPGLQQIDWHKTVDGKSIWTRCAFLDGVTTSSNKTLAFNTAYALTTFRSSIHSKILAWCVLVSCKPQLIPNWNVHLR